MLIAGRYQPLDASESASPLRARDMQTAQTVWLRRVALPPGSAERALLRAQAAKGVFHPSLITLFDAVVVADVEMLLAYEFVPAQTIAHVSLGQPLHPKRGAEIVAEVADAVAELHARDISHGGIAQATVLLTMKGKAKLDRLGDPSIAEEALANPERDLVALGDLLQTLVGRPAGRGVAGQQALAVIIDRARAGRFTSAAALAAMLRKGIRP
jgi:eukaryotic-like serine/threonine-protein kinase